MLGLAMGSEEVCSESSKNFVNDYQVSIYLVHYKSEALSLGYSILISS